MTTTKETLIIDEIRKYIEDALKDYIFKLFEDKKQEAIKLADETKGAIVAGVIINLMRMSEFEILKDRIIFTIKIPKE